MPSGPRSLEPVWIPEPTAGLKNFVAKCLPEFYKSTTLVLFTLKVFGAYKVKRVGWSHDLCSDMADARPRS
jgi:hypothetical protein